VGEGGRGKGGRGGGKGKATHSDGRNIFWNAGTACPPDHLENSCGVQNVLLNALVVFFAHCNA
jgi:hypothetical protein